MPAGTYAHSAADFIRPRWKAGYNPAIPRRIFQQRIGKPESFLGRVIQTTNPTRERNAIMKRMASAIREYSSGSKTEAGIKDLAAALISSLQEIRDSLDRTTEAWEKRNYWIKADAFRRQWSWVEKFHSGLKTSLQSGDQGVLRERIRDLEKALGSGEKP